jgi:hypothetical protein
VVVREELQVLLTVVVVVLVVVLDTISLVQVRGVLEQQDKVLEVETDQLIPLLVLAVVALEVSEEVVVVTRLELQE